MAFAEPLHDGRIRCSAVGLAGLCRADAAGDLLPAFGEDAVDGLLGDGVARRSDRR